MIHIQRLLVGLFCVVIATYIYELAPRVPHEYLVGATALFFILAFSYGLGMLILDIVERRRRG